MPQFGSVVTETIVASILFVRMPFNVILNGVYTFHQWTQERGDECPLITRGHSALLTTCGSNAFSLKSFFDSCTRFVAQALSLSLSPSPLNPPFHFIECPSPHRETHTPDSEQSQPAPFPHHFLCRQDVLRHAGRSGAHHLYQRGQGLW